MTRRRVAEGDKPLARALAHYAIPAGVDSLSPLDTVANVITLSTMSRKQRRIHSIQAKASVATFCPQYTRSEWEQRMPPPIASVKDAAPASQNTHLVCQRC